MNHAVFGNHRGDNVGFGAALATQGSIRRLLHLDIVQDGQPCGVVGHDPKDHDLYLDNIRTSLTSMGYAALKTGAVDRV